jgi:hypothetical protein
VVPVLVAGPVLYWLAYAFLVLRPHERALASEVLRGGGAGVRR